MSFKHKSKKAPLVRSVSHELAANDDTLEPTFADRFVDMASMFSQDPEGATTAISSLIDADLTSKKKRLPDKFIPTWFLSQGAIWSHKRPKLTERDLPASTSLPSDFSELEAQMDNDRHRDMVKFGRHRLRSNRIVGSNSGQAFLQQHNEQIRQKAECVPQTTPKPVLTSAPTTSATTTNDQCAKFLSTHPWNSSTIEYSPLEIQPAHYTFVGLVTAIRALLSAKSTLTDRAHVAQLIQAYAESKALPLVKVLVLLPTDFRISERTLRNYVAAHRLLTQFPRLAMGTYSTTQFYAILTKLEAWARTEVGRNFIDGWARSP